MTEPGTLALLRKVFRAEFEIDPDGVVPAARLREDLDLDSIDAVSLAARLESEIGVALRDESLRGLRTVADVMELVERLRPDRSA